MSDIPRRSGALAVAPDDPVRSLMTQVGDRVRRARERKGLSRRALSDRSGVSQRYLAQLEAGSGNISIGLLLRVAVALDHRIEWLVGQDESDQDESCQDESGSSEPLRVARLYRAAGTEQRRRVLHLLDPDVAPAPRARRVALIGLRGAGKSTLGRRVGAALAMPFVELNQDIEQQAGMPVAEIMALYGGEGYRRLEQQALRRVIERHDSLILAVAGGIVSDPATYGLLLRQCHTIWLKADPEEHMARVRAQGDERPMAGNPQAMADLRSILTSRTDLYARAESVVDTAGRSPEASTADVLAAIRRHGFLAPAG